MHPTFSQTLDNACPDGAPEAKHVPPGPSTRAAIREAPATRRRRLSLLMAGFAVAVSLAACDDGEGNEPPPPPPPPPPAEGTAVSGDVRGPAGTQVVLQNNGGDDLVVTVAAPASGDRYATQPFAFPTRLADGAAYSVSVKTAPAGQTCRVVAGGSGTMPVAANTLRVGCEYDADLVSRSSNDLVLGTYFDSRDVVIGGDEVSGEGRYVAFVASVASMAPGVTSSHAQIFWRDRLTGVTHLVSRASDGSEGNDSSWAPAISSDGRTVVFESYASNLVAGDANGARDVFVWSAANDTVGLVSAGGDGPSYEPTISGDGTKVAFTSGARSFTNDQYFGENVFLVDLTTMARTLVSTKASNSDPATGSRPSLSHDGSRLAYYSFSADIVSGDTNGLWDIFVYSAAGGTTKRVSLTGTGDERNQGTESASRVVSPAISGNGRFVAYATTATNLIPNDNNDLQDVFVVDVDLGGVIRLSQTSTEVGGDGDSPVGQGERVAISHDGSWVAFSTRARNIGVGGSAPSGVSNAVMRNWANGQTIPLSDSTVASVGPVSMTKNGAYAAFGSGDTLDGRFASTGMFARFTGVEPAWWWTR